ncbi:hypothetical protein M8C21_025959, partial [Ambrosia artemisiifolia]
SKGTTVLAIYPHRSSSPDHRIQETEEPQSVITEEDVDSCMGTVSSGTELAKRAAAACICAEERDLPPEMLGKLKLAAGPRRQKAAASKARAAFSAESGG